MQTEKNDYKFRNLIMDIFTSGMYGSCEPAVMYKFMMINLVLIVGTPFVLCFGLLDVFRGIEPLGYIITTAGITCMACLLFLRKTKNDNFVAHFLVSVLFCMFLYLLATGGSGNSGILWFYSFSPIALFLFGFRKGTAAVFASLAIAAGILYWPGTPLLSATYSADVKLRFIPSVIVLWALTSLFEHIKAAALKVEITNNELRETVEELSRAREALSSEKERLAVTLRSIGDGVIAADVQGNVVLINRTAEALTGYRQEEAIGKAIDDVVQVRDRKTLKPCKTSLKSVLEQGQIVAEREPKILTDRTGRERIISDNGAPIFYRDGSIIGAVLVFRDLTELVRMEEDLHRTGKLESVGLLAGGIAHDFNNILSGILGHAELAKLACSNGKDPAEYLQRIDLASRRATALTKQLLTFAKGGAPVIKSINLAKQIGETVRFALSGSSARSEIKVPDDLWYVYADAGQIDQVISNLVINAVQASPDSGIIEVIGRNQSVGEGEIASLAAGNYAVLTVRDHGTGIAPELIDKIFDPYFTTKQFGNGLGLPISYSIMKKHNGHIMFSSQPGKGTSFMIFLPASFEEAETETHLVHLAAVSHSGKILVVDDEADIRDFLAELFETLGYSVSAVDDGAKALYLYKEAMPSSDPFDLIITDLTIPGGMGGKETVERLLDIDPKAKVLVSSGYSNDQIMANFSRFGFKGAIEKPYKMEILIEMVARVIAAP